MKKIKSVNDLKKYDFDYRETWNLDYEIACFILPRLAYFKDHCNGYPYDLTKATDDGYIITENAYEEWERILDKMIKAFEIIVKNKATFTKEEERKIVQEGLDLFGKYYFDLWTNLKISRAIV